MIKRVVQGGPVSGPGLPARGDGLRGREDAGVQPPQRGLPQGHQGREQTQPHSLCSFPWQQVRESESQVSIFAFV